MKNIKAVLSGIETISVVGSTETEVADIQFDSRKIGAKGLFVAVRGTMADGHLYIEKALEKGAAAIVCEQLPEKLAAGATYVQVKNSEQVLGWLCRNFFDNPSEKIKLVGVTGTNGKTSTVTLLYRLFTEMGYKVGMLSTVENRIANRRIAATHTTPDAVQLNTLLVRMVENGCDYAFMEVSSHAMSQGRITGLTFAGGIFTNITHDHLDYHKTFQNYIHAKKSFFDNLTKNAFALTNLDDKRGEVMLQNTQATRYTYSLRQLADFKAKVLENTLTGLQLDMDGQEFHSRLIGEFNAYNLLAVYATAILLKANKTEVLRLMSKLESAEGRFDTVFSLQRKIIGIVDYAHTPDALEKVLMTIKALKGNGRVIVVVGCGGDRDREKRPVMAKIAADYGDQVILTADNPRNESAEAIIEEMETGVLPMATHKVVSVVDRKQAIRIACRLASAGDIVLVAGKGHEKYQEIKGEKFPFDDKKVLSEGLNVG